MNLDIALEYLDRGWSIIPLNPEDKRPLIKWRDYQSRLPTEEEIATWWTSWPKAIPAVLTGRLSGVYIVDCDSEDALATATHLGFTATPIQTRTKRGRHFWWMPPNDATQRGPRVGSVGSSDPNFPWPKVSGLDWRGDGGYAALPYPDGPYAFEIAPGFDWHDLPTWQDWRPAGQQRPLFSSPEERLEDIDLSGRREPNPQAHLTEWERTAADVQRLGHRIPTGKGFGRNQRVMHVVSEAIRAGLWDEDLVVRAEAFMDEFFTERLDTRAYLATVRSMMQAERRNHPDRFDEGGLLKVSKLNASAQTTSQPSVVTPPAKLPLVFSRDASDLLARASRQGSLISPLAPAGGSIIQVFGFSGHGKSTFVQHLLFAAASGRGEWGPFDIHRPLRTLYIDFENGRRTIADRLIDMRKLYGDPADRFATWLPFEDPLGAMDLNTEGGLSRLQNLTQGYRPDVVVLDTLRSAWPGFDENSATAWAPINALALQLRNAGLTVIKLHHSTKPSTLVANGNTHREMGKASGSTAQLNNLEAQLGVRQVYEDQERASSYSALWSAALKPESYGIDAQGDVWQLLAAQAGPDYVTEMMFELRFNKLRERTPEHSDEYLVAFCRNLITGERAVTSTYNVRRLARLYSQSGATNLAIAQKLRRSVVDIERWVS